ncbi:DUF4440 domain-containing protein [Nocardia sp. NPDC058176]|uniref:DUF4440 domain-containing protein n=1 Tax=Nocardia sp. NPDC058176 TaxID=3346368 RepID=UPI0036DC27A9
MSTPLPRPEVLAAVHALHEDLSTWLGSAAPPVVFERFAAAQHPAFSMVTTDGAVLDRDQLLTGLRGARNAQPGLAIEITEVDTVVDDGSTVVVRFRERHRLGAGTSDRRVSAVLVETPGSPLRWRAVHETPIS